MKLREGYSSFIGLILMMFRINQKLKRKNKYYKTGVMFTVELPIRWL